MDVFITIVVFLLAGLAGIGIGLAWDHLVTRKGWKGWYWNE